MTATAIGIRVSAPGPKESAEGTAPAMVATEIINMGRSRMGHASIRASLADKFFNFALEHVKRPKSKKSTVNEI